LAGDDVDVVDGVADEQRVLVGCVEDAVPIGVAGGVDHAEPTRHVELITVIKADHLGDF
jgi:inorganic pyrophosphatase